MQYLLNIDSPESQQAVLAFIRQFPDVAIQPHTPKPVHPHLKPLTEEEFLESLEKACENMDSGLGIPSEEVDKIIGYN